MTGARTEQADLSKAVKSSLPAKLAPQLATLTSSPPAGGGWLGETKFDGYRLLSRIEDGKAKLLTRNGHDWTSKMKTLATAVEALGIDMAWLDGEIVVLNAQGVPDFNALQNAVDSRRNESIVYFVFDAPFLGGYDLRAVPLVSRRSALRRLFEQTASDRVRFSESIEAPAGQLLDAACRMKLEGIVLKRPDAPYVSKRTDTWLKLKCGQRQEFVICGFTNRSGSSAEVGGILLGYQEDGRLRYAGSVGTGWDSRTGQALHRQLSAIEVADPPFDRSTVKPGRWSKRTSGSERWVSPLLVVEVAFSEWTPDGHVRHPSFKGLRLDKPAGEITKESPVTPLAATKPQSPPAKGPPRKGSLPKP